MAKPTYYIIADKHLDAIYDLPAFQKIREKVGDDLVQEWSDELVNYIASNFAELLEDEMIGTLKTDPINAAAMIINVDEFKKANYNG